MRVILFLIFISSTFFVYGQESNIMEYNEIRGNSSIKLVDSFSNGDLVLIGQNVPNNSEKQNIFIIRTTASGDVIWEKEFFSDRVLAVNDVLIDEQDNIILAAEQYSLANRESLFLLAMRSNGEELFSQHFNEANGEVEAYSITSVMGEGYMITGFCKIPTVLSDVFFKMVKEDQYLYLLKVNLSGEKIWSKYVNEEYFASTGKKVIIDKQLKTNIFSNNHKENKENTIRVLVSSNLSNLDEYQLVSDKDLILTDVVYDGEYFYLTGNIVNRVNDKKDIFDIFLVRINNEYKIDYSKIIRSAYNDWISGIYQTGEELILYGEVKKGNDKSIFLLELSKQGALRSYKTYNNDDYRDISLADGLMTHNSFIGAGSCWNKKKSAMLITSEHLKGSDSDFEFLDINLSVKKTKNKEKWINLSKKEIIEPVRLKEWKY
tara:strand:+ start:831 stop:2129 length:1299 start_codon:yes stop_codon:yes gene_type:complete